MEFKPKQVIGYINETLKGYKLVFGESRLCEARANKIITSIIGDMPAHGNKNTDEVLEYVSKHYNFALGEFLVIKKNKM